ncbi:NADH-quinone oxidoreductase subunit M [Pirellulimonas nuda]|uniref:NADH-quinone oxidoreductase subunit M n=1 Tax=Pirellulimonas nuda TaxID=2528009 RepID=A0A518DFL2_9BACT|nr:proton-conducting transporter membrane subunit [Pirellulimonas nuda]QDU90248.1 NADH-quinone oxidoreductase subunit M [Pirellulimonas nuda]
MTTLHLPWLELAVLAPLLGAVLAARRVDVDWARKISLAASGAALLCVTAAWIDLVWVHAFAAHDGYDLLATVFGADPLVIDELSGPLLPLAALQFFLTILATLRTKAARFSFTWTLIAEAIVLATLSCRTPWMLVSLMTLAVVPPWVELVRRGASPRVFLIHMALFAALLVAGQTLVGASSGQGTLRWLGAGLIAAAVLVRSGVAPLHCWMADLFDRASFGTALLFVTPLTGAYVALRLLLPVAPGWLLGAVELASLATALYASGMTLVQTDARRFFSFLLLSNASLVLVGLEIATPIGLTGGLCVWLSVGLALTGFGITLRCVEARKGRMALDRFHGLYQASPTLAGFFLLTGLASIGFPGTIGFIAMELLVDGAVSSTPLIGAAVVLVAALNGLAVMHAYFRIFTGCEHTGTIDLRIRPAERVAVLILSALMIGGGIFPQAGVASRRHAVGALLRQRARFEAPAPHASNHGPNHGPVSAAVSGGSFPGAS